MISVMKNNDFDLDRNPNSNPNSSSEEPRVTGDDGKNLKLNRETKEEKVAGDLNLNEEIRVSNDLSEEEKGQIEGIRVLGKEEEIGASGGDVRVLGEGNGHFGGVKVEEEGEAMDVDFEDSGIVGSSDVGFVRRAASLKIMGTQFEMGDMVWGKVKSHPWWPGHLFNEALATSSVRRTRREGHLLVAFFGDSSYGWFDPTELIPYDPHYDEKAVQTNSRNFVRAVEESVDEASRRSAVGLSCRCRNPYNFRPANVPGYVAVDVVDYEGCGIYSMSQIQKARDSFRPADTLAYIKQLALAPRNDGETLHSIKQKATTLAYRRAVFEEFDETYAQAFGQELVRPSPSKKPPVDKPSRAPLSGPLVIAEALGGRKSSNKAAKPKEASKKDKYLFKRRDEAAELRTSQTGQGHASSSSSSVQEDGTSDSAAATYVFQKRDQDEMGEYPAGDQVATSAPAISSKDMLAAGPAVSGKVHSPSAMSGLEQLEVTGVPNILQGQAVDTDMSKVASAGAGHVGTVGSSVKKKKKVAKRPAEEVTSDKSGVPEKKKKKKMKKMVGESKSEHLERTSPGSSVKASGKPLQIPASSAEGSSATHLKKEVGFTDSVPHQVGSSLIGVDEIFDEVPQMLADLRSLALNPFHGADKNRPAIARQFFLKFRGVVFLKSSSALSPPESEPSEARSLRSPPSSEPADRPTGSSKSSKPSKLSARHDDSAKVGRKRLPSERQEERAVKKAKKITEVKSLGAEKRAKLKNPDMQRSEGKVKAAASPQPRRVKTEQQSKKADRPPRVEEPTYLVMKFPPGSALPSHIELKARFARFGPLDPSLTRVFYTTYTCRIAFLYKQDANVAYRYAVGNKSVFANVKFMLKPVAGPEPQQPSTGTPEDGEPSLNHDLTVTETRPAPLVQLPQQPLQPLKSILKKPSGGDDAAGPTNGGGKSTRVRFSVGEGKGGASNKVGVQVPKMESRNAVSPSSESGPLQSPSSSITVDVVSNNQRFISSHPLHQPPILPTPQYIRPPSNFPQHHVEVSPRNNFNYNVSTSTGTSSLAPPMPSSIDISQQMMNLLTRCHDVVTNVKGVLGYVPYHSL